MARITSSRFILAPLIVEKYSRFLERRVRAAYYERDVETVRNLAPLLGGNLSRHYIALADNSRDINDFSRELDDAHKPRVLLSVAHAQRHQGEYIEAVKLASDSFKTALKVGDITIAYQSQKELAIIESVMGNHSGALTRLRSLFKPCSLLARRFPAVYYDYLNSLAVEYNHTGQITEARQAIAIALASPFASKYPEWSETAQEIEPPISRGQIFVGERHQKAEVVEMREWRQARQADSDLASDYADPRIETVRRIVRLLPDDLRWKVLDRLSQMEISREEQGELLACLAGRQAGRIR